MQVLMGRTKEEWCKIIREGYGFDNALGSIIFNYCIAKHDYNFLFKAEEIANEKFWNRLQWTKEEISRVKEKKMTRQEAIDKISEATSGYHTGWFVKGLEALGLIKFEEELTPITYTSIPRSLYEKYTSAIEAIEKAGYRIEKI